MRWRRHRPLVAALLVLLTACGGGSKHQPAPPSPPPSVLPSADRIKVGQPRLGGPAACADDEFCAAGLQRVYGIDLGSRIVSLASPAATVNALVGGAVDVGVVPSSAPERTDPRVAVLTDDRSLVPADNVVPVASAAISSVAGAALTAVSNALDEAGLIQIEQGVNGGASAAAEAWLAGHPKLTTPPGATPITIGARADPENEALADIYAAVLQRGGWPATVVQLDGQRADVLDALAGGRINLAIDNLSGLLEQVTGFAGLSSPDETRTLTILSNRLADLGLVALQPASATPGVDFLVTKQVQTALGLTTLSDLARVGGAHPAGASLPPLPTTSPAPTAGDLGIGSTGTAVLDLQSRLTALGYPRVPSSSRFDEATRRAVVGFQLDHGIIATGAAGPATLRALSAAPPTDRPSAPPSPGDTDSVHPGPITKTVYLAFAGGPSAITDQLLGLLRAHSATASFFATDAEVGAHPDALHAAATAGNATGVSMDPHDGTTAIGDDAVFRTAARTQDDLAALLGRTPSCLLAPYGAEDSATRARATDRGWKTVVWDVDPQDWRRPSAAVIVADVVAAAHPGAIVLLHDGGGDRTSTVQALGPLLDDLSARGYSVSAIPDCA